MSPMEELESLLQSLSTLKTPGITKAKIDAIQTICIDNVKSDSIIIQKIFTQFKKSANTHKLGVLYVVDSVARQWTDKARQAGRAVGAVAPDGTYASGIHKLTELLPVMMPELIQHAPANQKEKIRKLIDIWERSQTFPPPILAVLKQKLDSSTADVSSTTPVGTPPVNQSAQFGLAPQQPTPVSQVPLAAPPALADTRSLLDTLAKLAHQKPPQVALAPAPMPPPNMYAAPPMNNGLAGLPYHNVAPMSYAQGVYAAPPVSAPNGMPNAAIPPYQPNAGLMPQPVVQQTPPAASGQNEMLMQLLQALAQGNYPPEQVAQVLAAIGLSQQVGGAMAGPGGLANLAAALAPPQSAAPEHSSFMGHQSHEAHSEYQDPRLRERSRSPEYRDRRASPPNRRDSPTYGSYDPNAIVDSHANHNDQDKRGRGRGRGYRQRSPVRRPPSPGAAGARPFQPKYVEFDHELPPGHIKVLSRTLFVGGACASEAELRTMFTKFGRVQSCIANMEKRHAFVKMMDRPGAVAARLGMEDIQDKDMSQKARQVKWGVGFGPRDCSDYTTGVSIIPIDRLTDADRRWVVSAECGGTGGRALESGMVIEEPDIEIGAGVSSKAISRRVGPEPASKRGNHFGGGRGNGDSHRSRRSDKHHEAPRVEPNTIGVPPPVPGFGFQFPGMPMNMPSH